MRYVPGKYYPVFIILIIILLFPALFINLGLMPLFPDEATRALVALEMELSGNLLTPTINGEYYFNKPPLYNWILLAFFKISGSHSEWIIRLPAVLSLILFGLLIFFSTKKHIGIRAAFISAMAFITCGRILFYDSMLGLIDLIFSMLIFLNFILIYHFGKKQKFFSLFFLSYLITAVTFLMKGLPSLVFQGLTLVMAMIFFRRWKKLISLSHLTGILVFFIIAGSYYFLLLNQNPETRYFEVLVTESTKRTFIEHGWWRTILHTFTYPVEQLYHLVPWSLFFIFLLQKSFYQRIRKNDFLTYLALVFLVNIPVYWISVDSYPRYIFMLYPIIFILLIHHYFDEGSTGFRNKIFQPFFFILIFSAFIAGSWFFFRHDFKLEEYSLRIFWPVFITATLILALIWRLPANRLELLIIMLLVIRIGFNLIILPERYHSSRIVKQKQQAINVARISEGKELYLREWTGISHENSFYITRERMKILRLAHGTPEPDVLYIKSGRYGSDPGEKIVYRFETRWKNYPLWLVEY
ncbi:MAG: ArnT family glycosyltransferase [Bacteroidota bacterium]